MGYHDYKFVEAEGESGLHNWWGTALIFSRIYFMQIISGSDLFFDPSVFEPLIVTVKWLLQNNKVDILFSSKVLKSVCVGNAGEKISCFCRRGVSFSAQYRSGVQTGPLKCCSRNTNSAAGFLK